MEQQTGTFSVKKGLAQMLKGGVIMDLVTAEHAKLAEEPAPAPSWRSNESRRISVPRAALPA